MNLKKLLVTFSHSLFWQISCLLLVVTAFAFGALFLVLQISEDSTGKGSAINVFGLPSHAKLRSGSNGR